ncbi:MAG: hypothetical protein M3463_07210 [Verrucomicrobiota bacterium]|nr:hypothetical protein [Verrucomicrobiota bacterium]
MGNFASLQLFDEQTRRILKKWLNRRSQRRSYCWEAMEDLLTQFQIPAAHHAKYACAPDEFPLIMPPVRQRAILKSPVRVNCTPGSVGSPSGQLADLP